MNLYETFVVLLFLVFIIAGCVNVADMATPWYKKKKEPQKVPTNNSGRR